MKKVNFALSILFIICLTSCNPGGQLEKIEFKSLKENHDPSGMLTYEVIIDSVDVVDYPGYEYTHTNIKFRGEIVASFAVLHPYQPNHRDFIYASIDKYLYVFADEAYSSNIYVIDAGEVQVLPMNSDSAEVFVGQNIIWAYAYPKDRMIHIKFDANYGMATHVPEYRYPTAKFYY